jgi:hypothetical protein
MRVTIALPFVKETPGALKYGLAGERMNVLVADIYVRKDQLRKAGHVGPWPLALNITIEVAE